jgi:hypothetical protein
MVEPINDSPVEGLQQLLRIGGGSRRSCRIAKVRRAWGSNKSLIMTFGMDMRAKTHGGYPTMNAGTRQILHVTEQAPKKINSNGNRRTGIAVEESAARVNGSTAPGAKPRVFVAAENRLLRAALSRMLVTVRVGRSKWSERTWRNHSGRKDLLEEETDVLLLSSRGIRNEDLTAVRRVRTTAPKVRILLIGVTGEQVEFPQYVRAGVRGYLPRDASAEEGQQRCRASKRAVGYCTNWRGWKSVLSRWNEPRKRWGPRSPSMNTSK